MSCVPWEGGHFLCVQVASVSQARPNGGMWWAMCSKSVKCQCCLLQPDTAVMDGGGCLCCFVLPVMVTGKPQRPPLCVFTQPWISHRVCLSSLPRSLGSATVHTNCSFRNTHCISLLLPAEGSTSANLILPLFRLSLTVNSGP